MSSTPTATNCAPSDESAWTWHQRTLTALRARLRSEWTEHRKEAAVHARGNNDDFADVARDTTEHEVLFAELAVEENRLHEIDAALARLLNGSYGVCEETGRPIERARLRALPWTRLSHDAAERRELARRS